MVTRGRFIYDEAKGIMVPAPDEAQIQAYHDEAAREDKRRKESEADELRLTHPGNYL